MQLSLVVARQLEQEVLEHAEVVELVADITSSINVIANKISIRKLTISATTQN
jgi:hypothetical protein